MKLFPTRLALFIGVFAISGVIVQFLFPTFHSAVILPLFPKGSFDGYGLMGFTYQLDVSANYILLFEMIWLYIFKDKVNPFIYWTTLIIAILTIFLTGKRMHSLLSIIIPIIVYFLAMPHGNRRLWMIFFIGSIGILGVSLFINNADRFEESPFLRRFSTSVEKVQYNEDITSQRSVLTAHAIKLWIEKPILGIGDSNFRSHTEAETDVHNAYIQVLCEQGIIGFILWFIPIIYCFILTCRIFKNGCLDSSLKNWLMVSLFYQVQFILYGLTGNPTINEDRYILYFFAIAILSEIHTILIQRTSKTNI
jgi:O-antigen ligase